MAISISSMGGLMDYRDNRILRITTTIVLAFFLWTFGGVFDVAYAFKNSEQPSAVSSQGKQKEKRVEEKFQKAIDEIGSIVEKVQKVQTDKERENEKKNLKTKRQEIETLDTEIKKQFSETEAKIKDLPETIKQRHKDFVRKYEDNLKELKANLDSIDKARTKGEADGAIDKAKAHLEKVKPPKKHIPLDPNKLPHRTAEPVWKEPRTKPEEFADELRAEARKIGSVIAKTEKKNSNTDAAPFNPTLAKGGEGGFYGHGGNQKPILVAANGPLTGLMSSNNEPSDVSQLLAQASTSLPTADDLSETREIQFTKDIRDLAAQLNYSPVKIYEWVRNNINYQPYFGSFKGAQQTLLDGAGNDFDQANLLIALFRASNISCKYAYGTIEIPPEKIMNWVGGVSDPLVAGTILATQGIPIKLMMAGGVVKAFQLEHAWVEAWIDYIPSRGAVHKQGDTWIPLDPSFKQYTYRTGMDMYAQMGLNAEQFLQEYVTDSRDITAYQDYGMRMIDFIDANLSDATIEDVFGASEINATKTIIKQEFPYFMGTLPYKVVVKAAPFSSVPTSKEYVITILIEGNSLDGTSGFSYSAGLNYLADKRVTVSYDPATSSDEDLVAQYGGNILSVPPYLLNVKPVLRIDGSIVATGAPIGLGQDQNIVINFAGPDGDSDRIQNVITAGAYSAIILQPQATPAEIPAKIMAKLIDNSKNIGSPDIILDDLLGQMLYSIGASYFRNLSFENEVYARTLQLVNLRQPSEAMVKHGVRVTYLFDLALRVSEGGINIDVDRNMNVVVSPTQDSERVKAFMILSGLSSSAWENRILEAFLDVSSISTVRLLKLATAQGIPVYTITSTNLNEILPQLQISYDVKTDIANAVNAGKKVIISRTNVTYNQWNGVGYIVLNPTTGAAGYMISGGLAGGDSELLPVSLRRTPQFTYDYWKTFWIRNKALRFARAYIGTPYVWGGKTEHPGFDCSGLVHDLYEDVDSKFPAGTAKTQYQYCDTKGWLRPFDERLPGEIVWRSDLGHVGIEAGVNTINWPPDTTTSFTGETVVHASGRPCKGATACGTQVPCVNGRPACGTFRRVIESPLRVNPTPTDAFGAPADKVCSPR